tara:strand:+ start:3796 stop:4248 length:453 start_codon:yes stop_codon:yes gene_type:complete
MNRQGLLAKRLLLLVLVLPQVAMAGWQVSNPESSAPREQFFQAGTQRKTALSPAAYRRASYPSEYSNLGKPASVYAVSVSGSLKGNIERIMKRYKWKVIWKAPFDYNFNGKVTGSSLPSVMKKLLQPFPLQAVMYMSNRTVAIVPRHLDN